MVDFYHIVLPVDENLVEARRDLLGEFSASHN